MPPYIRQNHKADDLRARILKKGASRSPLLMINQDIKPQLALENNLWVSYMETP